MAAVDLPSLTVATHVSGLTLAIALPTLTLAKALPDSLAHTLAVALQAQHLLSSPSLAQC